FLSSPRALYHTDICSLSLHDALPICFEELVESGISDIVFNGNRERRLPHLSNISFRFIEGEGLLIHLDLQGVAVSTGSACSSGTDRKSTRLNSSHGSISYAVFCLKKK